VRDKAEFFTYVDQRTVPASSLANSPEGKSISIWKSKIPNSAKSSYYAVHAYVGFQNFNNRNCDTPSKCAYTLGEFQASVYPIELTDQLKSGQCLFIYQEKCGRIVEFPEEVKVSLSFTITNKLTGFLFGRFKEASITVAPVSTLLNKVEVTASPIDVTSVYAFLPKSRLSEFPEIKNYWSKRRANLAASDFLSNETIDIGPFPQFALPDFLAFEKIVQSGPIVKSTWKIGNGVGLSDNQPCFRANDKLLGIVATNAPIFSPNAPTYSNGFLSYQVAGAHHQQDKTTLLKGTYDLSLRVETAQCLYGFNTIPTSAAVSATYPDGRELNVASEVLRQDSKREWLYLSAQNFTFSAPTIKIKLLQPTPLPTRSASPTSKSKKTITCMKGKVLKKVSAINPTCPKGYLLKK
jgi:hypothetical protein